MFAEIEGLLEKSASIVLDSNGNGTIDFDVDNAWQRWVVDSTRVTTNQSSKETPYPTAEVFNGPIAPRFSQGKTRTGNDDTFHGRADLDSGGEFHVQFLGGIPGIIATARVFGKKYTRIA